MYYIITNGAYFHEKGKVILFDTPDEAQSFATMFFQYALGRAAQENGVFGVPAVAMAQTATSIEEWDEHCELPSKAFSEIKKERNI